MVKFRFWVPSKGWAAGGFENVHYAKSAEDAQKIVDKWNSQGREDGDVVITEITEVTREEFARDYIA